MTLDAFIAHLQTLRVMHGGEIVVAKQYDGTSWAPVSEPVVVTGDRHAKEDLGVNTVIKVR